MSVFEMNNAIDAALKMDVYAIYLRKSRADLDLEAAGQGETLARHKAILTDLAARKGLFIGEIYEEIVSGETIEARPQIQRLISDCYAGKYKGIICIEISRLSRGNQGDAQVILDCLKYANKNNGVLVITPTKTYDVAHNSDDEEYMEFELFMSRREYKMIKKRMDRGRKQAVVEGNYMGSYRPYGYNIVKTKYYRTLEPNPDEAPIVKQIFEWAVKENLSSYKIAQRLTIMGVPTYSGEREWAGDTVKTILTNPTYKGKVKWNDRMQIKTMVNGELVSSRPRTKNTDHYMEYDGKHKAHALVDEETFAAASSRYYNSHTRGDLKLHNPLAGLLICPLCGKAIRLQRYPTKDHLEPRYCHTKTQFCHVKSVLAKDLMNAFEHALQNYIDDFEMRIDNLPDVDERAVTAQIEALKTEIRKAERKLAKIFDDYEEGVYTANEFVQRKAVHNERIESIKHQIEALEDTIPEKEEYDEKVMALTDALIALQDEGLDAEVKNAYLKRIIDRIEFTRENNEEFIIDVFLK